MCAWEAAVEPPPVPSEGTGKQTDEQADRRAVATLAWTHANWLHTLWTMGRPAPRELSTSRFRCHGVTRGSVRVTVPPPSRRPAATHKRRCTACGVIPLTNEP